MPLTSEITGPVWLSKKNSYLLRKKNLDGAAISILFKYIPVSVPTIHLVSAVSSWCRFCGSLCYILQ
jgi:hypothetical protein